MNRDYESPYGFSLKIEGAYSPEEEKELYDKIMNELPKHYSRSRIMEITRATKRTHYNLLYNAALRDYKKEVSVDAEAEWELNKERLRDLVENAKADKDKIAAIKELNRMAEFSQINKKQEESTDNKFTINFNI